MRRIGIIYLLINIIITASAADYENILDHINFLRNIFNIIQILIQKVSTISVSIADVEHAINRCIFPASKDELVEKTEEIMQIQILYK
ncbi:MAG: hypothetical protein ACLQG5_12535 [Methanobacterium sp.]|jgi:hypothetical protein